LSYLVHAALGVAIWFATVQVAARVVPVERRIQLAALGIPVVLAAVAIAWIATRPRPDVLMQSADVHLGLKERLSTAWERRAAHGVMDDLLRQDALQHALRDRLVRAFPIRISRREAGAVVILAAAALALAVLPNPMDRLLAQAQADRASQAKAASTIHDVQKKIAAATKTAPVDPKVQKILSDTAKQIQDAKDPRQALEAISPAEQQLRQLSDPQTPARTSTTQNLAGALSTTNSGKAASAALSSSPSQGAQAVRNLAAQLPSLSPEERAQLAKALASAAKSAKDPAMAASLQRASDALSSGDLGTASAALNDLAGQLDSLQNQQTNDQQIASAINGLEAARQALAEQADRDAAGSPASAGASASPAAGASPAGGNGNGNANGNGNGSGSGSGNGNGSGGSSGTGSSGSGSGTGTAAKPSEKLYVPGQPVPGQQENDPTPLGPGLDVPLTPYTQVIQSYQQAALDATNQSLIPGSERDLVREYFARLGE
jgi:chemotaxis protein histidine kinase CheA